MKKLILALLVVVAAVLSQPVRPIRLFYGSTVPTKCQSGDWFISSSTGDLYICSNSVYVQTGAFSGGSSSPYITTAAAMDLSASSQTIICDVAGGCTFNLPAPSGNLKYCFRNYTGRVGAMTVVAPAGVTIDVDGAVNSTPGNLTSAGALGDSVCVQAVTSIRYFAFPGTGTWTNN